MDLLLPQQDFLGKYNIDLNDFQKTGLAWADLEEIYKEYQNRYDELDRAAFPLFNALIKIDNVHSVRYRIKDPEHVIEKIIRKKVRYPKRIINKENYLKELTDLIGLRAIHLFKDEWQLIHEAILDKWHQKEKPTYYFREGDRLETKELFNSLGCKTAIHPRHYRSVHYVIKTTPTKQEYFAEIQVRTLFEEGWSEIDHKVGYPYSVDNQVQNDFLSILNRLAGSADEMGTFIKNLGPIMTIVKYQEEEDERKVEEVKSDIDNNDNLTPPEKTKLIEKITEIGEPGWNRTVRDLLEAVNKLPKNSEILKGSPVFTPELLEYIKSSASANKVAMDTIRASLGYRPNDSLSKNSKKTDK